ncbi:unnamed protein product [Hermetia illucens]|uniref:Uncharacterized protein n=1 Tax=Hermetia illucens TaxID=343691 RepID=A0A7R8UUD1_HERIL|nr:general odorant-binding protein 99a-like isoform X1 [Hermetia illucens]CAD7087206.1 unnamed protein product [Hermetia illucens]
MKVLLVFCAVLALVYADWKPKTLEEWVKNRAECFESEKVSQHCQEEIKRGEYPHEPGCYFRCIGTKTGIWHDTNGFDIEKGHEALVATGWEVEKDNLKKCTSANPKEDDPCKWSAAIAKCMFDNKYLKRKE